MQSPACVAILPNGQTCRRSMKFTKDVFTDRKRKSAVFQCGYCSAIRVLSY